MVTPRRNGGAALGTSLAFILSGALAAFAGANGSELADAARRGNAASVRDLVESADAAELDLPGRDSMTPLLWAAQANDVEIARLLLDAAPTRIAATVTASRPCGSEPRTVARRSWPCCSRTGPKPLRHCRTVRRR